MFLNKFLKKQQATGFSNNRLSFDRRPKPRFSSDASLVFCRRYRSVIIYITIVVDGEFGTRFSTGFAETKVLDTLITKLLLVRQEDFGFELEILRLTQ